MELLLKLAPCSVCRRLGPVRGRNSCPHARSRADELVAPASDCLRRHCPTWIRARVRLRPAPGLRVSPAQVVTVECRRSGVIRLGHGSIKATVDIHGDLAPLGWCFRAGIVLGWPSPEPRFRRWQPCTQSVLTVRVGPAHRWPGCRESRAGEVLGFLTFSRPLPDA
jgi:hypothetical protein